jgi:hypothetical protein
MREEDFLRFWYIFNIWPYWPRPRVWTPDPGIIKITVLENSNYPFSFNLESIALKKMLFQCFTHKHYIPSLTLPWGQNRYPEDYKFHNFSRGLPSLHHHAFSFSSTCAVVEKIFENWSILGSFYPTLKAPRRQGLWNSKFSFPFTHKPNLVEIGSVVPQKKVTRCVVNATNAPAQSQSFTVMFNLFYLQGR